MSKIEKELQEATDVSPKRGEDRQDYLQRLVVGVGELDDKKWDKLSEAAQDWTNAASDAINKNKPAPDFPDAKKAEEEEEKPATRRRVRAEEEEEEKKPTKKPYEPKEGDEVKATSKRGKNYEGKVLEVNEKEDLLVLKCGKEEVELTLSTTTVFPAKEEEGDEPADPQVGDTVEVVTKKGKVVVGKVLELDEEVIALKKADDEEVEYARDRLESITVKVTAEAPKGRRKDDDGEEEEKPRSRSRKDDDEKEEKEEKGGKRTRSSNEGVSVGTRIRELIVEDFEASVSDIGKALTKEKLEYRDNTLKLVYSDTHKVLELLRKAKKLKG